jgi:hypothetical protein
MTSKRLLAELLWRFQDVAGCGGLLVGCRNADFKILFQPFTGL